MTTAQQWPIPGKTYSVPRERRWEGGRCSAIWGTWWRPRLLFPAACVFLSPGKSTQFSLGQCYCWAYPLRPVIFQSPAHDETWDVPVQTWACERLGDWKWPSLLGHSCLSLISCVTSAELFHISEQQFPHRFRNSLQMGSHTDSGGRSLV